MVADKREMSDQAQKLASRGLIDKAISESQKLIAGTPRDGDIHNTIGDLHLRVNRIKEAVSAYLKAAEVFRSSGFELKCAALLKKVIKIDPSRMDVYEKLADVHADRGLAGNAAADYLKAVHYYAQRGEHDAVLSVYQKLSRVDPNNAEIHVNIAETYEKLGLSEKAVEACEAALALHGNPTLTEGVRQRIEQILKISPNSQKGPVASPPQPPPDKAVLPEKREGRSDRMQAALRTGDWEGAQEIIGELTPDAQLRFLSEWFDAALSRDTPQAFLALRKFLSIAEQHPARLPEARLLLQRYVEAQPDHLSAHELLAETLEKLGNVQEAAPVYSKILSLSLASGSASDANTYYEMMKVKYPDQALDWKERFEPSAPQVALVEGTSSVFVPVSEPEPRPEPDSDDSPESSSVPEVASEEESGESMDASIQEAVQETASGADSTEVGEPILSSVGEADDKIAPVQELSDILFDSYLTEADVYSKYKLHGKAAERLREIARLAPTRIEPHLRLKEIYLREGMIEQAVEVCLTLVRLHEARMEDDQKRAVLEALGEIDPEGVYHTRPMPERDGGGQTLSPIEVCEGQAGSEIALDDVIQSEADTHASKTAPSVGQEDAEALLEKSLPDWISHRFSEIISGRFGDRSRNGRDRSASGSIETEPPDRIREGPESVYENGASSHEADAHCASEAPHLAEMKDNAPGPPSGDASNDFREAEPISLDDLEAHYRMGSTYREMGLIPEAMDEMAFVLRGDALFREATCLLACCYRDRGMKAEAIECLRRALEDTRCGDEDARVFKNQIALFQGITGVAVADAGVPDVEGTGPGVPESSLESSEGSSLGLVAVLKDTEGESLSGNRTDPSLSTVGIKRKKKKISYL